MTTATLERTFEMKSENEFGEVRIPCLKLQRQIGPVGIAVCYLSAVLFYFLQMLNLEDS